MALLLRTNNSNVHSPKTAASITWSNLYGSISNPHLTLTGIINPYIRIEAIIPTQFDLNSTYGTHIINGISVRYWIIRESDNTIVKTGTLDFSRDRGYTDTIEPQYLFPFDYFSSGDSFKLDIQISNAVKVYSSGHTANLNSASCAIEVSSFIDHIVHTDNIFRLNAPRNAQVTDVVWELPVTAQIISGSNVSQIQNLKIHNASSLSPRHTGELVTTSDGTNMNNVAKSIVDIGTTVSFDVKPTAGPTFNRTLLVDVPSIVATSALEQSTIKTAYTFIYIQTVSKLTTPSISNYTANSISVHNSNGIACPCFVVNYNTNETVATVTINSNQTSTISNLISGTLYRIYFGNVSGYCNSDYEQLTLFGNPIVLDMQRDCLVRIINPNNEEVNVYSRKGTIGSERWLGRINANSIGAFDAYSSVTNNDCGLYNIRIEGLMTHRVSNWVETVIPYWDGEDLICRPWLKVNNSNGLVVRNLNSFATKLTYGIKTSSNTIGSWNTMILPAQYQSSVIATIPSDTTSIVAYLSHPEDYDYLPSDNVTWYSSYPLNQWWVGQLKEPIIYYNSSTNRFVVTNPNEINVTFYYYLTNSGGTASSVVLSGEGGSTNIVPNSNQIIRGYFTTDQQGYTQSEIVIKYKTTQLVAPVITNCLKHTTGVYSVYVRNPNSVTVNAVLTDPPRTALISANSTELFGSLTRKDSYAFHFESDNPRYLSSSTTYCIPADWETGGY